jgi:predicted nucleic acid-binding protein
MEDVFPDLVMDACCLINLYAAGILSPAPPPESEPVRRKVIKRKAIRAEPAKRAMQRSALAFNLHVPAKVMEESLYIRKPDDEDQRKMVESLIDLTLIVNEGLLHPCDLQNQVEMDLFVQLATTLDDGEAMSLAIAKVRGWEMASDDRKARRVAGQLAVSVLTTAELVKVWAENTGATDTDVSQVLLNIQTFARFIPHKTMPLHQWWLDATT